MVGGMVAVGLLGWLSGVGLGSKLGFRGGPDYTVIRMGQTRRWNQGVDGNKIVALVEVRNVARASPFFFRALAEFVDATVVLDDHSDDETVALLQRHWKEWKVERVIRMRGTWMKRQEQRDREILLKHGRVVHGTHFVLLDYDEFVSWNCIQNGRIRSLILKLSPGQSLKLPWIEAWRSIRYQRVMPGDLTRNFLDRRQIVIFADDQIFRYDTESSLTREIGSGNGSIHTLKCPRSLCPRVGPGDTSDNVVISNECSLVELKFINLDNTVLKGAWYEALGRFFGADDTTTRGGMMKFLEFPHNEDEIPVVIPIPSDYGAYPYYSDHYYNVIESWRARQILEWLRDGHQNMFSGLPTYERIDWSTLQLSPSLQVDSLTHLPFHKRAMVAVVIADHETRRQFDSLFRWPTVNFGVPAADTTLCFNSFPETSKSDFERRRWACESDLRKSLSRYSSSEPRLIFADGLRFLCLCGDIISSSTTREFEVVVVNLTGPSAADCKKDLELSHKAPNQTQVAEALREMEGSVTVIELPSTTFSTLAGVSALRTLLGESSPLDIEDVKVVIDSHRRRSHCGDPVCSANDYPVARLIFSANAGRSGSKYLSEILATLDENIISLHEPACPENRCTSGGALSMQRRPLKETYATRKDIKAPMIMYSLAMLSSRAQVNLSVVSRVNPCLYISRQRPGEERYFFHIRPMVYAETNPNFKSWFYDIVFQEFGEDFQIDVVVIHKYLPALVKSLYETGFFTVKDGHSWMETAHSVNSFIRPMKDLESDMSPVEQIISYVLNFEASAGHIISQFSRSARFSIVRAEELFDREQLTKLLQDRLELRVSDGTRRMAGTMMDKRRGGGGSGEKNVLVTISLEECKKAIEEYLETCRKQRIHLPDVNQSLQEYPAFGYM